MGGIELSCSCLYCSGVLSIIYKKYINKNEIRREKKIEEERRRGKRRRGWGFANLRRCGMNSVNGC